MQAANSEAKGAQRHAVLAANFEEHALAASSKVLDALCRAAKAQSCRTARSSRATSDIGSLRRGLKDLDFEKSTNRKLGGSLI